MAGDEAGGDIGQAETFDDLRHPDADAERADNAAEIDQREQQNLRGETIAQPRPVALRQHLLLLRQTGRKPALLAVTQPGCLARPVGEQEQAGDAEQHGGQPIDEEQPRAKPENGRCEPQILVHLQGREADIDAVEIADNVANEDGRG